MNVMELVQSERESQIVFAPKKDRFLHIYVDYRKLNAVTVEDAYPILENDEFLDAFGKESIFSTLNVNSGYYQFEIDDRDQDKTTFTLHQGLYRFL